MKVSIQYIRPQIVMMKRVPGPYGTSAAAAWRVLRAWLLDRQIILGGRRFEAFGCIHFEPADLTTVRHYDACVALRPVPPEDPAEGILEARIVGGAHGVYRFQGSHAQIIRTINELRSGWLAQSGFVEDPARPVLEVFVNDPAKVAKADLLTDICIPIIAA